MLSWREERQIYFNLLNVCSEYAKDKEVPVKHNVFDIENLKSLQVSAFNLDIISM